MGMASKKKASRTAGKSFLICGDEQLLSEYSILLSRGDADIYVWHRQKPDLPKRKNIIYSKTLTRVPKKLIAAFELTNISREEKTARLNAIEKHCARETIILSSAITQTVTEQSILVKYPHRLVGLAALPSLVNNELIELSRGPFTQSDVLKSAGEILFDYKKEVSLVDDRIAMVMPRILCCLINEATFALQEEVASMDDIDTAMKLGTNYPNGPVEWGESIGFDQVLAVMEVLHIDTGEDRYRPSPLLRKLAAGTNLAHHLKS